MTEDKYFRHVFTADGEAVGRAYVCIHGKNGQYRSRLEVVPEYDFYRRMNRMDMPGRPSAQDVVNKTVSERYPDLVGLGRFIDQSPSVDPASLDFRNACARAALTPPPIFNEKLKIYLRPDYYGPAPTDEDRLRDRFLVANAGNAPDKPDGFVRDFSPVRIDKTKIFTLD